MSRFGKHLAAWLFALLGPVAAAQPIPVPMSPPRLVNDYAGVFEGAQRRALEDSLLAYERSTSVQIAVVTVADLAGYTAADWATKILSEWGVGNKERDNGVVLLLKPRNQYGGGAVFIATGYGVEGALPDITAGRIIDREMLPFLQQGDYYRATVRGTAAIRQALLGEYAGQGSGAEAPSIRWMQIIFTLIALILLIVWLRRSYRNGGDDNDSSGSGRNRGRRPLIFFPPMLGGFGGMGRSSGGGFGGFGGFGGGGGGGGGAGRSF